MQLFAYVTAQTRRKRDFSVRSRAVWMFENRDSLCHVPATMMMMRLRCSGFGLLLPVRCFLWVVLAFNGDVMSILVYILRYFWHGRKGGRYVVPLKIFDDLLCFMYDELNQLKCNFFSRFLCENLHSKKRLIS